MQLADFKRHVQAKIEELESVYHGQQFPDETVFDESEFLDYFGYVFRRAYISVAGIGFVQEPPATLISRDHCLFYLRQLSAWCDTEQSKQAEFLTVGQAADRLQVSKDSIYDLIKQGNLEHTKVGRTIRIKPSALQHIQQPDGW